MRSREAGRETYLLLVDRGLDGVTEPLRGGGEQGLAALQVGASTHRAPEGTRALELHARLRVASLLDEPLTAPEPGLGGAGGASHVLEGRSGVVDGALQQRRRCVEPRNIDRGRLDGVAQRPF